MARPTLSAGAQRLRIVLALPALLAIFGFGQAILDRRAWRLDLTPGRRYTLSAHARQALGGLPPGVRLLAFLRAQDPRNPVIEDLLRQVKSAAPGIQVDVVDVNRSPALAREYGVDAYGALVMENEGRRRVFANPREDVLVAAALQVTRQQRKTVAWVVGHGEGDLTSGDRRHGFTTARVALEQEYYEVRPVSLLGDEVPVETAVLVIAGPEKDLLPHELAALERYLARPGHALVMLDPLRAPALAELLGRYGVTLRSDVVVDPGARLFGGEYLTIRLQLDRRAHPILEPLEASALFSLSRSVELQPQVEGTTLLQSGPDSWATGDTAAIRTGAAAFHPEQGDRPGPITVGVEAPFVVPPEPGEEPRLGRLVVYGNADFASNFFIEFLGNRDLFVNTVDWLAREPASIGRRAQRRAPGVEQFFVSEEDAGRVFWTTAVLQPAVLAALGLLLAARRRWG